MANKYQKELDAIQNKYEALVDTLDLDDHFLGELLQAEVITSRQKSTIASKQYPESTYYLLDDIIINSLRANMIELFDAFLSVISDSSQGLLMKRLANEIKEKAGRPTVPTKVESPPVKPPPSMYSNGQSETTQPVDPSGETEISGDEELVDKGAGGKSIEMYSLLDYMQCVCRIENSLKSDGATGFVGKLKLKQKMEYFIVTSHDAIPDEYTAKNSIFLFNYVDEKYKPSPLKGADLFNVNSGQWFWTDEDLKYTAMKVIRQQLDEITYSGAQTKNMKIPGILMSGLIRKIEKNHILSIIQQTPIMKLSDGVCSDADPSESAVLMYRMDTGRGSEGAPIFKEQNSKIRLIAMHIVQNDNHGVLMSEVVKHMMGEQHKPWPLQQ